MGNEINEEEVRKHIEEKLNQTGLPLEEKVSKVLQKYFPAIRRNAHYLDKELLKDRDVDFVARNGCYWTRPNKKDRTYTIDFELILECKKAPTHAWIFTGEEDDRISSFEKSFNVTHYPNVLMPEFVSSEPISDDMQIQDIIKPLTSKLFTAEGYVEIKIPNKKLPKEDSLGDNHDNSDNIGKDPPANLLYSAILQVIKASRYRQEYVREDFPKWVPKKKDHAYPVWITVFQPVIVFDGLMYRTTEINDRLEIKPIKFVRMEKEYLSSEHHETDGEIHIVSIDWLVDYLELLKNTYRFMDTHKDFWKVFGTKERRKGFL